MTGALRRLTHYVCLGLLLIAIAPSSASAQWTNLTNAPPGFMSTCVLLTDGRAMCHGTAPTNGTR